MALETYCIDPSLFSSDQKFPPWIWEILTELKDQEFQLIQIAKALGLTWTESESFIRELATLPQFIPVEQTESCYGTFEEETLKITSQKERTIHQHFKMAQNSHTPDPIEVIKEHYPTDQNQTVTLEF